ncbi:hypothetical protein KUW19_13375 [Ferrimonas balearica]|uniref:protein YgfX n=1 Tax=Ferrimonas balearica TaxID=44012 RepID=UPI001C95C402|nr:protein YgfX [Ferrimonas balearica]MBY6107460.1 hypothetical protein [Ferrimonas balearica]
MSAISPERSGQPRQRYQFYPTASHLGRRWRIGGLGVLILSVAWQPTGMQPWLSVLKLVVIVSLLVLCWRQRGLPVVPAFALDDRGRAHWLADGTAFQVLPASRLLPGMALLVWQQDGRRQWGWQFEDSYDRAGWRRLCRLLLMIQRGDRIVGPDSGSSSG